MNKGRAKRTLSLRRSEVDAKAQWNPGHGECARDEVVDIAFPSSSLAD